MTIRACTGTGVVTTASTTTTIDDNNFPTTYTNITTESYDTTMLTNSIVTEKGK